MSYVSGMRDNKKRKTPLVVVSIRLNLEQKRKLDTVAKQMRREHGGRYTRSDAVRLLIDLYHHQKRSA